MQNTFAIRAFWFYCDDQFTDPTVQHGIDYTAGVKCFKCSVTVEKSDIQNTTVFTPICNKFDKSEDFVVDCPFSTMCLKTISTLHLQNEKLNTIVRGCAPQKETKQVFKNRRWQQEHSVEEVYDEGCIEFKENHLSASSKTHCYCRGNLCNSGPVKILANRILPTILMVLCYLISQFVINNVININYKLF